MSLPGRTLQGVLFVVTLSVLAGCGGSEEADAPSATPTTTPAATPTQPVPTINCAKVLSQRSAETLAAQPLGRPKQEAVSSLPGCRWTSVKTGAWVQALAVPASDWAQAIPAAIGTVLDSGLEFEGRDQLDEARRLIEEGGELDSAAACRVFSTMASAVQGFPVGSTKVINYVPNKEAAQGINEQACIKGRYYSVQLISPTLKPGLALEKRIRQALAELSG